MNSTRAASGRSPVEIWGGVECSYVRIGDRFVDQFALSGHDDRLDDLDRLAELGLRALRYPVSWERMVAGRIDWDWAERRLSRLRELEIQPIVGFVHHGGGPLDDGLLSPDFAPRLAEFAAAVAERFPWIDAYTPVNEPVTTARFSGLYGLWHPHGREAACFARCLVHEIAGTREAMRAIRAVNPRARLVLTEDIGKTHATPLLQYQADFENERRWIGFDLLCGRVDETHPLFHYLRMAGVTDAEFAAFRERPCPPDVIGMNHYVTSERFLDERMHHYPPDAHGGNGRHTYADVPALRARSEGALGPAKLLGEAWARYRTPIAITEVQLACSREEQLRWLGEVWHATMDARARGIDVRAITPWALLGSHEWDSLLTESRGTYETGAFDLRGSAPRPTALARAIKALATTGEFKHPVLETPGWWRRPDRLIYPPVASSSSFTVRASVPVKKTTPLLVVGANGTLARAFLRGCESRAIAARGITRRDADLTQWHNVRELLAGHRPWAVINCAGYTRIDAAETDVPACNRDNLVLASVLAEACADAGVKFATFSTDHVFDGRAERPYLETDVPAPLNAYGRSKHEAEQHIAARNDQALVVRTAAFFGYGGDFVSHLLRELAAGRPVMAAAESTISPTFVPELASVVLDLLIDDEAGVWHLTNGGSTTWFDWAKRIASWAGRPAEQVRAATAAELGWAAARPRFSPLLSQRGALLSSWETAMERYVAECVRREQIAA